MERAGITLFKQDGGAGRLVMLSAEGWDGSAYQRSVVAIASPTGPARRLTRGNNRVVGGAAPGMETERALQAARETHQSILVTLKKDGRPQLSNVRYTLVRDDGIIRVSITDGRPSTRTCAAPRGRRCT